MSDKNNQSSLPKEELEAVFALYSNAQYQEAIDQIKNLNQLYPNVPLLFNIVGACYKALDQLPAAVKMFETAVNLKSDYAEAYKNLGITFKEMGNLDSAIKSFKQVVLLEPEDFDTYYNLGNTFKQLDRQDDSIQSYQKAIAINSNFFEAYNNLGNYLKDLGFFEDAIKNFEMAIAINPNFANAHNNLGNAFKEITKTDEAILSYQNAIKVRPNFAEAHNNLGNTFKDLSFYSDAIKSYKKAIAIDQNLYEAHYNLGVVLMRLKKNTNALISLKKAISINPYFAKAHNNLGSCFSELGKMAKAIECYKQAIKVDPDYAHAHNSLGNALNIDGKVETGVSHIEKAIVLKPDFAEAHNSLGAILKKLKYREKALECFERAYSLKPELDYIFGSVLNTKMHLSIWSDLQNQLIILRKKVNLDKKVIDPFNLLGLIDDPALQKKASEIRAKNAFPKNNLLPQIDLYPRHKKIRIGYCSADFREHPVAYLTAELYELHDRDHYEIHAFSYGPDTKDEMNLRIKAGVDHFHDVKSMSHEEVALLARSLEIDIAIDLGGFTAKARTDIFAMLAAPIQLSYIGFLGTMGAEYYDYLIADPVMIPKKYQKHYSEKIIYLPSFQVNDSTELPPDIYLTRHDVGLPAEGFVFCCFNNTYKFTPNDF